MHTANAQFAIKPLLDSLRSEFGDSEFGYRMQGFFAHALIGLGAKILEINHQGHPDIKAWLSDTLLLVQVKSSKHGGPHSVFQLSNEDFAGIAPGERCKGYLAFLDCAEPVSWVLVEAGIAHQFLKRSTPIAGLKAARDLKMSQNCTEIFAEMILSAKDRLGVLTFSLLAKRALAGSAY